jgi:hypothetical protein
MEADLAGDLVQKLQTVINKQVENFDRVRQVEERLDALLERFRKCEDRTARLETILVRRPPRM